MNKQVITMLGALVTAVILVIGVLVGVVPLVGGVFAANQQRVEVEATNRIYETQLSMLKQQQERIDEINDSVAELRMRVPTMPDLDQVFERVAIAARSADATVGAINRGSAAPYEARPDKEKDDNAAPAPAEEDSAASEHSSEGSSGSHAEADPASGGKGPDQASDASASTESAFGIVDENGNHLTGRIQIALSFHVVAPSIKSAHAFLDGLREGKRAIAIDTATITQTSAGFEIHVEALAFVDSAVHGESGE